MKEKFQEIKRRKSKYNQGINDGATDEDLRRFNIKSYEDLGYFFPDDYLETLKLVNGLEYNGFILYGTDEYVLKKAIKKLPVQFSLI